MLSTAHFFANALNPLLVTCLFCTGIARGNRDSAWRYWLAAALGIGLSVVLAEAGKHFTVWPGHPSFPSGHESFGVAASACLAAADRRWLWAVAPICLLLAWSLVAAGYHDPIDVAAAALLAPWCPLAVFRFFPRRVTPKL